MRVMEWELWEIIKDLVKSYVEEGLIFCIGHIIVALFALSMLYKLFKEKKGLKCFEKKYLNGNPDEKDDFKKYELAPVYINFCEDLEGMKSDSIIPITDYTDRIDLLLESYSNNLHLIIGQFVIIGLAGTFFGLFKISINYFLSPRGGEEFNFAYILSEGMRVAFPVGFMGLLLSIIFTIIGSIMEHALSKAVKETTQKIYTKRRIKARETSGAWEELRKSVDVLVEKLRNFTQQISEIEKIPAHLLLTFSQQTKEIIELQGKITNSLKSLKEATQSIRENLNKIGVYPELLEEIFKTSKEKIDSISDEFKNKLNKHSEELEKIFSDFIKTLKDEGLFKKEIDRFSEQIEEILINNRKDLAKKMKENNEELNKIMDQHRENLEKIITSFTSTIENNMGNLPDKLFNKWKDSTSNWEELEGKVKQSIQSISEFCRVIQEEGEKLCNSIASFREKINAGEEISFMLNELKESKELLKKIGENLETSRFNPSFTSIEKKLDKQILLLEEILHNSLWYRIKLFFRNMFKKNV
jgi:F0F1-type ATP synthase membrane subunit b/b'